MDSRYDGTIGGKGGRTNPAKWQTELSRSVFSTAGLSDLGASPWLVKDTEVEPLQLLPMSVFPGSQILRRRMIALEGSLLLAHWCDTIATILLSAGNVLVTLQYLIDLFIPFTFRRIVCPRGLGVKLSKNTVSYRSH